MIHNHGSTQFVGRISLDVRAVSRSQENRFPHPSVPAAFQIDQFVADHVALAEVYSKLVSGIEKELRRRLAAAAGLFRVFWRHVDRVKADSVQGELAR